MVAVARMFARFLHVESCGQCGACKLHSTHLEGTPTPSRPYQLPKIVDMAHGTVTYDTGTALEQPDRTYVDVRRAG
jgi:NADH-ubiquinone oxidoreductase-F iron-sulfur binding region